MKKLTVILCWLFGFIILGQLSFILFLEAVRSQHVETSIKQERYTK
jgi:hypothetical protein